MKHLQHAVFATLVASTFLLPAVTVFAADNAIPQRADIDDQYKRRVEDMYSDVETWEADFAYVESNIPRLEQYRGRLGESPETIYGCLALRDSLAIVISDLYVFAFLKLSEDGRMSMYQELGGIHG